MVGQKLGHYGIEEKIGAGGMGVVYRARDERLDRDVALKVLPSGTVADEAARKRFRKEALTLSQLNHPNIATVHDFDTQDGIDFLVMEHVAGTSLAQKLASGPLPQSEVAALGTQIAEALEEAHAHGVVHRDLKPANVMMTLRGRVKVLDFGLAKLLQPASESAVTESIIETRAGAATVPYAAPEQLRAENTDARTDIYALGAVLYEMATGRRPFPETHAARLIDSILHEAPKPPRELNGQISPALEQIILKALEKDPEHRYQSARELRVDLERLSTTRAVTLQRHRATRLWPLALAGALVALLVLAASLYLLTGRDKAIDSIAVLPFVNVGGDPSTEYLSDGMTETLINSLSQLPNLKVMSRNSVFRFKGRETDAQAAGRELGVRGVLTGRIVQRGDSLSIRTELVDARDNSHIWGEQYNRKLADVLVLQEEIARQITERLRLKLSGEEQKRLAKRYTENTEAYQLYLKGRYSWNRRPRGLKEGIRYFEQAIEKDPSYALAYSGLADSYAALGTWEDGTVSPGEAMPKAHAAAIRALQIDETLAEVHASLAYIKLHYNWDWLETERELKRAIELNPSYATAHHWYSHYLMTVGRTQESLAESKRALELDPLDPIINGHQPWSYYYAHQYDQAIETCKRLLEMDPNMFWARFELGRAYEQKGRVDEAIRELNKAITIAKYVTFAIAGVGHAYAVSGQRGEAQKVLNHLKEISKQRYVSAADIAMIYVGLGEKDEAFAWLQKAYLERSWYLVLLGVDPRLDGLRSDPRFTDLARRVGLPP